MYSYRILYRRYLPYGDNRSHIPASHTSVIRPDGWKGERIVQCFISLCVAVSAPLFGLRRTLVLLLSIIRPSDM